MATYVLTGFFRWCSVWRKTTVGVEFRGFLPEVIDELIGNDGDAKRSISMQWHHCPNARVVSWYDNPDDVVEVVEG
jgi:hypothetical protein